MIRVLGFFLFLSSLAFAQSPALVSKLYIDNDGNPSDGVELTLTSGTDSAAGLKIDPGSAAATGLQILLGDLILTNGDISSNNGVAFLQKDQNAQTYIWVMNEDGGANAHAALVLQNDLQSLTALELRSDAAAARNTDLVMNINSLADFVIYGNTTAAEVLRLTDPGVSTWSGDMNLDAELIISSGGSVSNPAIEFDGGTVPAQTGLRYSTTTGDLYFAIGGTDELWIDNTGTVYANVAFEVDDAAGAKLTGNGVEFNTAGSPIGAIQFDTTTATEEFFAMKNGGIDFANEISIDSATQTLTADNQSLTVNGTSYAILSSDSATATDRTFDLPDGLRDGQVMIIQWGSLAGELLDDTAVSGGSGFIRLEDDWVPSADEVLVLIFDGTDWIEVCRSVPVKDVAEYYISSSSGTSLTATTPALVAGTTTAGITSGSVTVSSSNRVTYTGSDDILVKVTATCAMTSSASNIVATFSIAENGTVAAKTEIDRKIGTGSDVGAIAIQGYFTASTNDYFEVWVESDTNTTLTVSKMNVTLEGISD